MKVSKTAVNFVLISIIYLVFLNKTPFCLAQAATPADSSQTSVVSSPPININNAPLTNSAILVDKDFPDVNIGSSYYVGIKYLKNLGLIQGYADGTYQPQQNVNRAEALKILTTAIKYQLFNSAERPLKLIESSQENQLTLTCPFPDLNTTAWYFPFVCEAFKNKIIGGYPDGTFKPEQTINKVEALKMSILESGLSTNIDFNDNFNDIKTTDWFWNYAKLANQKSFIVENRQGNLNPSEKLNRGDFAMLIYRILRSIQNNSEFGRATFYAGRFDGKNTANGETFSTVQLTAAHKTLPFGTMVKVTNLANNKAVLVRINDRGPYVEGAIIDLSTTAFTQIASKSTGVIDAEVEVINN